MCQQESGMKQLQELKLTWEKRVGAKIWEQVQECRTQDRAQESTGVYQDMNQQKNAERESLFLKE